MVEDFDGKMLAAKIDGFQDARVSVIGDIILDQFLWGDVTRISPEAPVPVVDVRSRTEMLGGAANVIRNLKTLGCKPLICGIIGADRAGEKILDSLRNMDLDTEGIVVDEARQTTVKTRVIAHSQQVVRFDREDRGHAGERTRKKLLAFIDKNIPKTDVLVVSDYGKGVVSPGLMEGLRDLVQGSADQRRILTAVDPKTGNFVHYRGVDVITPNHIEAGMFCGLEISDVETLLRAGRRILSRLDCRSVLITRGKHGMTLFERDGRVLHIPTVAKKVFDVTGAGDTVISCFSLGLASGLDPGSAAVLSNYAAGIVVGEVGTSAVRAEDLKDVISEMESRGVRLTNETRPSRDASAAKET